MHSAKVVVAGARSVPCYRGLGAEGLDDAEGVVFVVRGRANHYNPRANHLEFQGTKLEAHHTVSFSLSLSDTVCQCLLAALAAGAKDGVARAALCWARDVSLLGMCADHALLGQP